MSTLRWILICICCFAFATPSQAGPNAGGVVIVHATPPIYLTTVYDAAFCGESDTSGGCESLGTNLPLSPNGFWIWWVAAAFPENAEPRLKGVSFGIDYDDSDVFITLFEFCGDLYIPTGDWPEPGTGTAVAWATTQTATIIEICWFAGYEYYGYDTQFCIIPDPVQGGNFADDSVPSELDPIADYGCLGFNADPGYLPCPGNNGACCFPDDSCLVITESSCLEQGGSFIGDGVPCVPYPCGDPTPAEETTWGRIKADYR